jgi:hypothetical protein
MPAFDSADTHVSKRTHCASEAPIMISQDDARQGPSEHHMLYFLGLASRARSCRICLFSFISLCSTGQAERPTSPLCGHGAASLTSLSQLLHRYRCCGPRANM